MLKTHKKSEQQQKQKQYLKKKLYILIIKFVLFVTDSNRGVFPTFQQYSSLGFPFPFMHFFFQMFE